MLLDDQHTNLLHVLYAAGAWRQWVMQHPAKCQPQGGPGPLPYLMIELLS
jgi:hypothetical protein